ncbi:exported hypothetical protein [Gammaproteobacteria bacterium]
MIKVALALILLTAPACAEVFVESHTKQYVNEVRINRIYKEVLDFTGFKDVKIKLIVFDNDKEVCAAYRHWGYTAPCPDGFTLPNSRVIWVSSLAYWLLVHEFTHALSPDLPRQLREVLPKYVVGNL